LRGHGEICINRTITSAEASPLFIYSPIVFSSTVLHFGCLQGPQTVELQQISVVNTAHRMQIGPPNRLSYCLGMVEIMRPARSNEYVKKMSTFSNGVVLWKMWLGQTDAEPPWIDTFRTIKPYKEAIMPSKGSQELQARENDG